MGRLRNHFVLEDSTLITQKTIPKNDQYSVSSTERKLLSVDFTEEIYEIKSIYDQIETPHADMCFSTITINHSVYKMDKIKYFKDLF